MDSPIYDKGDATRYDTTRYSTPEPELDDHRHQSPIPAAQPLPSSYREPARHHQRRTTNASSRAEVRSDVIQSLPHMLPGGSIGRDFEHPLVDDDSASPRQAPSDNGKAEDVPGLPRRGLSRRGPGGLERFLRTRDRSPSDRTPSRPNSVDAFAEPRRQERRNTVTSKNSSLAELTSLRRAPSRRTCDRVDFSAASVLQNDLDTDSERAEDDVCFPQEEPCRRCTIDFDALEEFAAETRRDSPDEREYFRQHVSFSSQANRPKLKPEETDGSAILPPIVEAHSKQSEPTPNNECAIDDSDSYVPEKIERDLDKDFGPRREEPEPNRFAFFSSEIESTIHAPSLASLILPGETFRDLFDIPLESGTFWLDVMNPTPEELEVFQKAFGIHRLTAEDIESQEHREKVELFKSYYFVCFRSFHQSDRTSEEFLQPLNFYMIVFREGILTFSYSANPHAADVRRRIGKLRNYISLTADWVCYALVDNIVDSFFPVIHDVEVEVDTIEDQAFIVRPEDVPENLRRMAECRKKVMQLMRLLGGKADVIRGFAKRCNEQYSMTPKGDIGLYLSDIQDHVVTMMSNLGHFEKILSRSHANYLAQVSVDSLNAGNRANDTLAKITLLASVLVPLNLVCGLFGMNVPVPGNPNGGNLGWFFGILGFIFCIAAMSLAIARKLRYI